MAAYSTELNNKGAWIKLHVQFYTTSQCRVAFMQWSESTANTFPPRPHDHPHDHRFRYSPLVPVQFVQPHKQPTLSVATDSLVIWGTRFQGALVNRTNTKVTMMAAGTWGSCQRHDTKREFENCLLTECSAPAVLLPAVFCACTHLCWCQQNLWIVGFCGQNGTRDIS